MAGKESRSRDRIIGARLRAIRKERTTFSLEAAAKEAQWSSARLSRTENGLRRVTVDEVATLLTTYKIPVVEREEILAEIRTGSSSGWWDRLLPGVPAEVGTLASYEADANRLVNVSTSVMPGLLHTYETAKALMPTFGLKMDIETCWMARLRRQQILGTVDFTAYICETVLWTPYGGREVLRAQLEHVLRARDRGVEVRVIPAHQTDLALMHSWHWMGFPAAKPVVHVELTPGAFYLHDKDAEPYTVALGKLDRVAYSRAASRKVITKVLEGI